MAALVGAVAIVANSMSKDRKVRDPITGGEYDAPPPRAGTDYGDDLGSDAPPPPVDEADFSDIAAQDDALADSCARAARDEAERDGGFAEVRSMASPVAAANGGYNIDGQVEPAASPAHWTATAALHRSISAATWFRADTRPVLLSAYVKLG